MLKSLDEILAKLPLERQQVIETRAQELIAEEMVLRDLRLALKKTQKDLAAKLQMRQGGISRLEKRSDMLISNLHKYIQAMGGTLKLTAEFPNRTPIEIHGIAEI